MPHDAPSILETAGISVTPGSLVQVGPRSYRTTTENEDTLVKIIPKSDRNALASMDLLAAMPRSSDNLVQQLLELRYGQGYVVALFRWVQGESLTSTERHRLPEFFASLARWHTENRTSAPLRSRYTMRTYAEPVDYLRDETAYHCDKLGQRIDRKRILDDVLALSDSPRTIVHGDVHPGNVLFCGKQYTLIDPEMCRVGLALEDLDYILLDGEQAKPDEWWWITTHARPCLDSYFSALAAGHPARDSQLHGLRTLSRLRFHSNAVATHSDESGHLAHLIHSEYQLS